MALYALASGFLNAYNSSEASKRLSAAKREEIARQIAREDDVYERERRNKKADYEQELADKRADQKLKDENAANLRKITEDANVEKERLKLEAERIQKEKNSILNRNKVLIEAVSLGVASDNAERAAEAQELFNILFPVYLQKPDFTFKDLPENFLDQVKKFGSNETPEKEKDNIVSFGGGLGAAGNKPGNQGIDPKTYLNLPGKIINQRF